MRRLILLAAVLLVPAARADQPIMNMMPRWDGGWGVQGQYSYRHNPHLLDGSRIADPELSEDVHVLHLEGVYTWTKELRMTLKVPYVLDAKREFRDASGEVFEQRDSGIGDATLSVPLKRYFNQDGRSGSWSFVPQVRIPLGHERDAFEVYDGDWGTGLSLGYEAETTRTFIALGLTRWVYYGNDFDEFHAHLDLGLNFMDQGQALVETDLHAEDDDSWTVSTGPALYWRFTDVWHSRIEYKFAIYDDQGNQNLDHGDGSMFKVGLGMVF